MVLSFVIWKNKGLSAIVMRRRKSQAITREATVRRRENFRLIWRGYLSIHNSNCRVGVSHGSGQQVAPV